MSSHEPVDEDGNQKVECRICGKWFHQLASHLGRRHGHTVDYYREKFPGAETMSEWASKHLGETVSAGKTGKPVKREKTEPAPVPESPEPKPTHAKRVGVLETLPIGVVKLDVLDPPTMDEESRSLIPTHDENYYLDPTLLEDVALGFANDCNVLLVGPNGCGKTTMVRELCSILNRPSKRIPLNSETRAADFIGSKTVVIDPETRKNKVVWVDGIFTQAARKGWVVILDELDMCPPGILARLQETLEVGHPFTIPENDGEVVKAHKNFRIYATANTVGRGDSSGLFPNRKVLDEATLDRFGMVREVSYLPSRHEAKILCDKTGVSVRVADLMVATATKVREALNHDECRCSFSTRRLLNWASFVTRLGETNVRRAAEVTVLHRLVREDREFVKGVIDRIFPR